MSYQRMTELLASSGVNPVHARPLFRAIHRELLQCSQLQPDAFSPPLERWLKCEKAPVWTGIKASDESISDDGWTQKYLLEFDDKRSVEAVQMGFPGRYTACLSSQVGCAMGCVFCATGQMGYSRQLEVHEIVAQAYHVERAIRSKNGGRLRNIVMMGMGEPLHNFERVMAALDLLTDTRGLNIGPARVAISTVGYIPGIQKLARHPKRYSLAVSLHGSSDEERNALVPLGKRWPLADLLTACREYSAIKRARVFFAWTLIRGVNDSDVQARRLVDLLRGMDAHVNLIPLNPTAGFDGETPSSERVTAFQSIIQAAGIPSTVRQRRGIDVAAGCGQLGLSRKN
jgi:23S rRNA (adenine2503-C2)-methyltransferase